MKQIINIIILITIVLCVSSTVAGPYEIVIYDGVPYRVYPETSSATAYDGFGWERETMPKNIKITDKIYGLEPFYISGEDFRSDTIHKPWMNRMFTVDTIDMRICAAYRGEGLWSEKYRVKSLTIPSSVKVIKQLHTPYIRGIDTIKISSLEHWFNLKNTHISRQDDYSVLCVNNEPIQDLVMPTGIPVLKKYALPGISLKSLTISEGVEKIETAAVYFGKLDSITLPESLREIEKQGLWSLNLKSLRIKSKKLKLGENFIYSSIDPEKSRWKDLYIEDIAAWCSVGGGIELYHDYECGQNPCHHSASSRIGLLLIAGDTEDGVLYVPEGVEHVKTNGLYVNHDKVKGVVLPASLKEIDAYAFVTGTKDKSAILQLKTAIPPKINKYTTVPEDSMRNYNALRVAYEYTVAYVPKGSGDAYRNAYGWSMCREIIEGEPDWSLLDGVESNLSDDAYKITDNYISYSSEVKLIEVFDIKGNQLIKLSVKDSGVYSLESLGEGVYLVRINGKDAKKIMR